ncbi:MAG: hypothetical protein JNM88_12595 [Chitinophagaceae bacterium]|nr:hypothetical protein [Chitinophagaceae bacterium]
MRVLVTITCLFCAGLCLRAQTPQQLLERWHTISPIEKVYLHFDRQHYVAGETAWFKAYLSSDYQPSANSTTLYIELIGPKNEVITRLVFPVLYGCSNGQIDLPDSLVSSNYLVRAYTASMLNLPPGVSDPAAAMVYEKLVSVTGRKNTGTPRSIQKTVRMEFFPEGGNFVSGINNTVAFKLTNEYGLPVNGNGVIETEQGEQVTVFSTYHDGMGVFELEPENGKRYLARFEHDGQVKRFPLPDAVAGGVVFRIVPDARGAYYEVFYKEGPASRKPAYLLGQLQHNIVFRKDLREGKNDWSGALETRGSTSGIMQITVFDANNLPLAERLIFIDNKEYRIHPVVKQEVVSAAARSLNKFSLSFRDTITGNFSISVTDADYTETGGDDNIISSLLLTSDLKGYIHQPGWYFAESNDSAKAGLDLLMMVNGWRRFNWTKAAEFAQITPRYKDKGFISVVGRIVQKGTEKKLPDYDLSVMVTPEDSTQAAFEMIHTDKDGRFRMDSLIFYGKTKFYVSDIKGKKSKWITIIPDADSIPVITSGIPPEPYFLAQAWVAQHQLYMPDFDAIAKEKGETLQEIRLVTRKKSAVQELDEKYSSGMFSGLTQKVVDLVNTKEKIYHRNIFDYIEGRVAGIDVVRSGVDYQVFYRQNFSMMGGRIPMTLYLDEMQADANIISTIPADQVAMIKVYSTFVGAPGNGAGGVLAVYTKKGSDIKSTSQSAADMFVFKGYTVTREFYSPDYSQKLPEHDRPDNRITLAWQPLMLVDAVAADIPMQFYNNDRTKRFRLVVEGMTWNGKLVHEERIITAGDK